MGWTAAQAAAGVRAAGHLRPVLLLRLQQEEAGLLPPLLPALLLVQALLSPLHRREQVSARGHKSRQRNNLIPKVVSFR
jgi:hypothetical protein